MCGQRSLAVLAPGQGVIDDDVAAVADELLAASQQLLDVGACEMCLEQLARDPALDEGEPPRVVGALVERVEDAAVLSVGGLEQGLQGLGGFGLLARQRGKAILCAVPATGRTWMSAQINHVSVNARDLQASVDFYVDLLGAEPIDTPNFGFPVQWLALGRTQLHLSSATCSRRATITSRSPSTRSRSSRCTGRRSGARRSTIRHSATTSWSCRATSCSSTSVIPPGNLVEIDCVGVDRLSDELRAQLKHLWDFHPQDDENMRARLFVPE